MNTKTSLVFLLVCGGVALYGSLQIYLAHRRAGKPIPDAELGASTGAMGTIILSAGMNTYFEDGVRIALVTTGVLSVLFSVVMQVRASRRRSTFQGPTRAALARRRDALLTALEAVSQAAPTDSVAVGQRVRFALDAWDTARARETSALCAFSAPYCLRLSGLVAEATGQGSRADSLFQCAALNR